MSNATTVVQLAIGLKTALKLPKTRQRQSSYRIDIGARATVVVHANRLRPYYARVSHVRVVFEEDQDFTEIECTPRSGAEKPDSLPIGKDRLVHLPTQQRTEIAEMFAAYSDLIRETSGAAEVGLHKIQLHAGYRLKCVFPYHVPELARAAVSGQVNKLLNLGLMYPVES